MPQGDATRIDKSKDASDAGRSRTHTEHRHRKNARLFQTAACRIFPDIAGSRVLETVRWRPRQGYDDMDHAKEWFDYRKVCLY